MAIDEMEVEQRKNRPGLLTVLCILSFISTGLGFLMQLFNLLVTGPVSEDAMIAQRAELATSRNEMKNLGMSGFADVMDQLSSMMVEINNSFYLAGVITLFVSAIGFFGVLDMFKGRKRGFHMYIIYCILSIASLYIYVSPANIPTFMIVVNLIFSGLFVGLYSINLKWLK